MTLSADEVVWAYRLLLRREPESDEVIAQQMAHYGTLENIKRTFVGSSEFEDYYQSVRPTASRYGVAPFLLPEPIGHSLTIALPTMAVPTSQLCTHSQFGEADYQRLAKALQFDGTRLHRKNWEWCYIVRALEMLGMIEPGKVGLGFGCGTEPLPSYLASHGVRIVATDAPPEVNEKHGWSNTLQYASSADDIWNSQIVDRPTFDRNVSSEVADMRRIPSSLRDFDFTWSSCSLEHLGSLQAGLDFILASMDCLKPGGIAIHTTEFNLASNDETVETDWLSIYRRQDIDRVVAELTRRGHVVSPVNYFPGSGEIDAHVDVPPFGWTHLKLAFMGATFTSIGLIVRKSVQGETTDMARAINAQAIETALQTGFVKIDGMPYAIRPFNDTDFLNEERKANLERALELFPKEAPARASD